MDSREDFFCIGRAQKALFSTTSMMITVLKDSALRYFKHRNVHSTDGHTRIHSGKRFHFMSNTFRVEVSGHYILLFSVTQRAVGSRTLKPASLCCKVCTNCILFEFNYLNVRSSSASRHGFLSSSWLQLVCQREAVCQASREFRGLFI